MGDDWATEDQQAQAAWSEAVAAEGGYNDPGPQGGYSEEAAPQPDAGFNDPGLVPVEPEPSFDPAMASEPVAASADIGQYDSSLALQGIPDFALPQTVAAYDAGPDTEGISGAAVQYGEGAGVVDEILSGGVPYAPNPLEFEADLARQTDPTAMRQDQAVREAMDAAYGLADPLGPEGWITANNARMLEAQERAANPELSWQERVRAAGFDAPREALGVPFGMMQHAGESLLQGQTTAELMAKSPQTVPVVAAQGGAPANYGTAGISVATAEALRSDPVFLDLVQRNPVAAGRYAQEYDIAMGNMTPVVAREVLNPVNYLGLGLPRAGLGAAARTAAAAGHAGTARGLETAAHVAGTLDDVVNLPFTHVVGPAVSAAGRGFGAVVGGTRDVVDRAGEVVGRAGPTWNPFAPSMEATRSGLQARAAEAAARAAAGGVDMDVVLDATRGAQHLEGPGPAALAQQVPTPPAPGPNGAAAVSQPAPIFEVGQQLPGPPASVVMDRAAEARARGIDPETGEILGVPQTTNQLVQEQLSRAPVIPEYGEAPYIFNERAAQKMVGPNNAPTPEPFNEGQIATGRQQAIQNLAEGRDAVPTAERLAERVQYEAELRQWEAREMAQRAQNAARSQQLNEQIAAQQARREAIQAESVARAGRTEADFWAGRQGDMAYQPMAERPPVYDRRVGGIPTRAATPEEAARYERGQTPPPMGGGTFQGAIDGIRETLEQLPGYRSVGPETQSYLRSVTQSPAYRAEYESVRRARETIQQGLSSGVRSRVERAQADLAKLNLPPGELPDPAKYAQAAYVHEVMKGLGWEPPGGRNVVAHAIVSFLNDVQRAGALFLNTPWMVWNAGDQLAKSAFQGMSPYVASGLARGAKFGFDTLPEGMPASWVRTMGTAGRGVGHEAGMGMVAPGVRPGIEHLWQALKHARDPGPAGPLALGNARPLERTWGTLKEVWFGLSDLLESSARYAMGLQTMERVMNQEMRGLSRFVESELVRGGMAKQQAQQLSLGLNTLKDWSEAGVRAHLEGANVAPELLQQVMARWSAAHERGIKAGETAVSKVHANYADRSNLEANAFFQGAVPFSKWALNNLKYYAEALMSRPAAWAVLRTLDELSERDNELGAGLPPGLSRYIQLSGGLGSAVAQVLFGDPRVVTYINPLERAVTMPGQRAPRVGPGATALGKTQAEISAFTGIQPSPIIRGIMEIYGQYGDVAVSSPLGMRTGLGAAAQGAYGLANPGRSLEVATSRAGRNVAPPMSQSLNEKFGVGRLGAGPSYDSAVMREMTQQGVDQGLNPHTSPEILESRWNPNAPRNQAAQLAVEGRMIDPIQQQLQGMAAARGMQPVEHQQRASQNRINEMASALAGPNPTREQRDAAFNAAIQHEEATYGSPSMAEMGWGQMAQPPYLDLLAQQTRTGVYADRKAIEGQAGLSRPEYPGQGASSEQLAEYGRGTTAYQNAYGMAGQQAIADRMAAQQTLSLAQQRAAQMGREGVTFQQLQKEGFGPWSGDRWETAKAKEAELRGEVLTPAYDAVRQASALTNAAPMQGPGLSFEEQILLDPQMKRAAELRGYLETLPVEQRGLAYTSNPEFAELREWDARNRSPAQTGPEQQWADRRAEYAAIGQQYGELVARNASPQERNEFFAAVQQKYPGGDGLPSYAEWQQRNQSLDQRLESAIREAVYAQLPDLKVSNTIQDRAQYAAMRDALDPVVQKVWAANRQGAEQPTSQEIAYAANKLGITVPGQTVAPSRSGNVPGRDDWAVNPNLAGGIIPAASAYPTVSLQQRQQAVQAGALTPMQPTTPVVAGRVQTMMQPGVAAYAQRQAAYAQRQAAYAQRQAAPRSGYSPRTSGGVPRSSEPFSGTTARQQIATASAHVQQIRDTQGVAAANKWIYDNYDRWKEVREGLGQTVPARETYGARALELSTRPDSFGGMTFAQGMGRLSEMHEMLKGVVGAERPVDRAAFANSWEQRFGEKLTPEDLTPAGLAAKMTWVQAQFAQGKRYEGTAEGMREVQARDQQRQDYLQAVQARDQQRAKAQAASEAAKTAGQGFGSYAEAKAQGRAQANDWWNNVEPQRKAAVDAARDAASREWDIWRDLQKQANELYEKFQKSGYKRK